MRSAELTTARLHLVEKANREALASRRKALILHADPMKRRVIASAVPPEFDTVEALASADALKVLETERVDLMIADATFCAKPLLALVGQIGLSGRCVFLSSPESVNRLIDGFSRGHAFGVAYDTDSHSDLRRQIAGIVHPRASTRHTAPGIRLSAEVNGRRLHCEVVDVSNHGCAVVMPETPGQEPLFPGTYLPLIELHRNGELVLGDTAGTVRHLDVVNHVDGTRLFQAGVEFQPFENASDHPAEEHVVRDRVVIAASLEAALVPNSPGLYLNAPGLESERVRARSGVVEFDARLLSLTISRSPGWEPGDVCRVVFELGGTQHVFWSSVLEVSDDEAAPEIVLTLPKAVAARRCRNTQRFKPPSEQPVSMTLTAPLLARTIETDALDITASGASFAIDGRSDLLPIGTRLDDVEVNFPHGASFQGSARVRSLHAIDPDGGRRLKCGIEFEDLHPVERAELADYVVRCVRPEVSSGLDSNFDEIWSFLKKSGFLYPEKLRHLDVPQIRETMTRLLERPNDVFKTWICRVQGEIVAHISAVRLFDGTWGVQHLAAAPHKDGVSRARLLNMALTEYCEQHPEIDWVRICYRPTNQWPARVFGTYAQKMVDRELSELRTASYLVAPTAGAPSNQTMQGLTVRDFLPEDVTAVESYFVSKRRSIQLRSADISNTGIELGQLDASFGDLGLFRRRNAFIAERGGKIVGFALAEVSSPGLNLSELTNTASVHLIDDDPLVLRRLTDRLRTFYGDQGRDECIILADEDLVPSLLDFGFTKQKEYCCWTWHRSLWRRFYEHSVRSFR